MNTPEPLPERLFCISLDWFGENKYWVLKRRVTWRTVHGRQAPLRMPDETKQEVSPC